jgi:hypothetical protein
VNFHEKAYSVKADAKTPTSVVVATDTASVDADRDNGAAVHNSARSAGCGGGTAHRINVG